MIYLQKTEKELLFNLKCKFLNGDESNDCFVSFVFIFRISGKEKAMEEILVGYIQGSTAQH